MVGSDSPVEHRPLPSDDPIRRRPNIDLARDRLGWSPTVSLDDGLKRTVEYFRDLLAA
jgi:UDP-glucuronate decarboxylase